MPTSPEDLTQEFLSMAHRSRVLLEVILAEIFNPSNLTLLLALSPSCLALHLHLVAQPKSHFSQSCMRLQEQETDMVEPSLLAVGWEPRADFEGTCEMFQKVLTTRSKRARVGDGGALTRIRPTDFTWPRTSRLGV